MTVTKNVVELLTDQHRHITKLFDEVQSTSDATERSRAFDELRRMLSVHEAAEEIITHPQVTRRGGGDVVEERQHEEHEAKQLLSSLDSMGTASADFESSLAELRRMVLAHARAEEELEFPVLLTHASPEELERMASAVKAVERIAPTHPHPAAGESATVNAMVGPLAAVIDKVRDAARDAMR